MLLENKVKFVFDESLKAFESLKERLIFAHIIISLDWTALFELICESNGIGLGVFLG